MKVYKKHLSEPWFSLIRDGVKTVEGRLHGGDFREMVEGDRILFFNNDTEEERRVLTEVQSKRMYDSFSLFLRKELANALPGVQTVEEGVRIYHSFYPHEAETRYGVVAVEVKVVDETVVKNVSDV